MEKAMMDIMTCLWVRDVVSKGAVSERVSERRWADVLCDDIILIIFFYFLSLMNRRCISI